MVMTSGPIPPVPPPYRPPPTTRPRPTDGPPPSPRDGSTRNLLIVLATAVLGVSVLVGVVVFGHHRAPVDDTPPVALHYAFLTKNDDGSPIRWDPCRSIHYRVRLTEAPENGLEMLQASIQRVEGATGLKFVYDGTTDEIPQLDEWTRHPNSTPVWMGWSGMGESDKFSQHIEPGRRIGGRAGPDHFVESGTGWRPTSGTVWFRTGSDRISGFAAGYSEGNLMLHELGHLVGLDHVDDSHEVMYPSASDDEPDGYGPGDLEGLRLLGAGAGCEP